MKSNTKHILLPVLFACFLYTSESCRPTQESKVVAQPDTTYQLTPYNIILPQHFPKMAIPSDNQPSVERIALGRMLYYDEILSNDGRACASCHFQSYGFTVPGMVGNMPVLSHVNLAWHERFMWDGSKTGSLEDVMLFETKEFFATNLEKINASEKYRKLFRQYFGVDYISHKEIAYSLAQFTRTMISKDSRYDRYMRGAERLTYAEEMGMNIFFSEKGDCFHCHTAMITTDGQMHNTGLDSAYGKEADKGYFNITGNPSDLGKFRTPNLRNVALRQRFMHDGRFKTLEEVIEFYDHGVKIVSNIDPIMTKQRKDNGLNLNQIEKQQLVAFLKTLTDETFTSDTSFSKPTF